MLYEKKIDKTSSNISADCTLGNIARAQRFCFLLHIGTTTPPSKKKDNSFVSEVFATDCILNEICLDKIYY